MKTLETAASSSEEETSFSSEEEPPSQKRLKTNAQSSDSEFEESEYDPDEEESDELGDPDPKSLVPAAGASSKKGDSKGKKTAENISQIGKGKKKRKSYNLKSKGERDESGDPVPKTVVPVPGGSSEKSDSKGKNTADNVTRNEKGKKKRKSHESKGPQLASSSRSTLKAKGNSGDSKKNRFGVWSLEDEVTLLNSIHEFQLKEGRKVDSSSIEPFCDLLKGRLSFTEKPGARQVSKKIEVLKKKYFYSVKSFTVEHDLKMKEIADRAWKRKSSKREFPRLKAQLGKLDLLDLEEELKHEEKAIALESKLKMQRINDIKVTLKRLELEKEILKFHLEDFQKSDG